LKPSVIHAATPHLNASAALAVGRRLSTPVVYEVRGFLEQTWAAGDPARVDTDRYRLTRSRETAVMQRADAVVTLAEVMRQEIIARGVPSDRVVVVPNAVDAGWLAARPDRRAFRDRVGIRPDDFVVGSVSSITAYEGFGVLLRAAALLTRMAVPVTVLLVGDGPELGVLRRDASGLGLSERVVMPGRVPPALAQQAIAALDLLCVPRVDVPVCRAVTPLKPVEAMALGVPVVASDLPALREMLLDGEAGVLVTPGSPRALASAIADLHGQPSRRGSLARAGRNHVSRHRTWQTAALQYRELYARLGALQH
jgi:glycosyltransferase involved in cell wall biosynthesis